MASAVPATPRTPPTAVGPRRRPRWPADPLPRGAVRLGLAAPLVALAVWADRNDYVSQSHQEALRQAAATAAGGADLGGIDAAYPPLPTLLAGIVPGGALGLCVLASLAAGYLLHAMFEHLLTRGLPPWSVPLVLLPIYAVPSVAFLASQSITGIVLLAMLAVATQGYLRFARDRSTEGGFIAGLALAVAFSVSPIAVFYAVALGASTVFIARERYRDEPAAVPASVGVVLFPTAFAMIAWAFLEWRFAGRAFGSLIDDPQVWAFPGGVWPALGVAVTTVALGLFHSPLYVVVGIALAGREPLALLGYLLPVAGSVVAAWSGLLFTQVSSSLLFTLVALIAFPQRPKPWQTLLLLATALGQLALNWVWPPTSVGFASWSSALFG